MTIRRKKTTDDSAALKSTASSAGNPPGHWREGRNRLEKSELVRDNLLWAAAEVVGEVGYAAASIARITQKAGLAQGTFYNYFETRQDILDTLLPALGEKMRQHVRERALGGSGFADMEERGFLGFFEFLQQEPHFFRILNEAESFAPESHKKHFDVLVDQYMRFLQHSLKRGEFPEYKEEELEVVAFMLMAARSYLALKYMGGDTKNRKFPTNVVDTYMKFIRYGLEGQPAAKNAGKPKKET